MGVTLARWFYSVFFYMAAPFILTALLWQSRHNKAYRQRFAERFGYVERQSSSLRPLLVHCASVGEFLAAKPLLEKLLQDSTPVWISCTTPTGSQLIQDFLQQQGHASSQHSYLPFDLPGALERFLQRVQPQALVLMETEIWPNLIYQCQQREIPVALINARMSERSQKGYFKFASFLQPSWQALALCAAQNEIQAQRFLQLGVRQEALQVSGNLKFDLTIKANVKEQIADWQKKLNKRLVLTAASTHAGEEAVLLAAFESLLQQEPTALLILVPRHQERFDDVAELIAEAGFTSVRRSSGESLTAETQVFLADSMGEMMLWYGLAEVAFVGGSLIERGGHNPLEPLAFGVPILSGPFVFNFMEVFQELEQQGVVTWVQDSESIAQACQRLFRVRRTLASEEQGIRQRAQTLFTYYSGATERTYHAVQALMLSKVGRDDVQSTKNKES